MIENEVVFKYFNKGFGASRVGTLPKWCSFKRCVKSFFFFFNVSVKLNDNYNFIYKSGTSLEHYQ